MLKTKIHQTGDSLQHSDSCLKLVEFHPDYNIHEYPVTNNGTPLSVEFQVNLRNVLEVNEVSQIVTLETTIRMFWTDGRVKVKQNSLSSDLDYVTLNPKAAGNFWIPGKFGTFFVIGTFWPKYK